MTDYLMPGPDLPYIVLNKQAFKKADVDEKAAEDEVAALLPDAVAARSAPHRSKPSQLPSLQHRLPPAPQVAGVYTRLQLATGQLAAHRLGPPAGPQLRLRTATGT